MIMISLRLGLLTSIRARKRQREKRRARVKETEKGRAREKETEKQKATERGARNKLLIQLLIYQLITFPKTEREIKRKKYIYQEREGSAYTSLAISLSQIVYIHLLGGSLL